MHYKIFFCLGFIAPIPLFLIPRYPFFYINIIKQDTLWIESGLPPYTGYTSSLGLAAPLILLSALLTFGLFVMSKARVFEKNFLEATLLILFFSIITLYLSNSIKVLGPISSFTGFMMVCFIFQSKYWKSYSDGFLYGISLFCIGHALSILFYGIEFSKNSEGISIFNIEIYQSLVSYAALISFFFGTLLLNSRIFNNLSLFKNNLIFERAFYLSVISSSLLVLAMTSRRLSLLICLLGCLFLLAKFLINGDYLKKWKTIAFLMIISVGYYLFIGDIYSENKNLSYINTIEPRLEAYMGKIHFITNTSFNKILFGSMDGWAQIENGVLDIILNTGLLGLLVFTIFFIYASLLLKKIALGNVVWNKNIILYLIYSSIVLFLNNTVNNGISTPYFFISFLIIFTISIRFISDREQINE